jgi:tol-pal system protein YbgF
MSRFAIRHLIALAFLGTTLASHAGLFSDDEARNAIIDLRQRTETDKADNAKLVEAETKRASEAMQLRLGILDLQNQLETLRGDIARLRGQNEQLAKDLSDMQRRQKDMLQPFEDRLKALEPVKVSVDGVEFKAEPGEKRDFEASLALFRKGDFVNSANGFVDFLTRNPMSGYRPTALFWLGTAQYATKDCKSATTNFRNLISIAPDHMRVPESLLSIANCQLESKDTKAARKTLEDLIAAYPNTDAATAAKDRLTRFK